MNLLDADLTLTDNLNDQLTVKEFVNNGENSANDEKINDKISGEKVIGNYESEPQTNDDIDIRINMNDNESEIHNNDDNSNNNNNATNTSQSGPGNNNNNDKQVNNNNTASNPNPSNSNPINGRTRSGSKKSILNEDKGYLNSTVGLFGGKQHSEIVRALDSPISSTRLPRITRAAEKSDDNSLNTRHKSDDAFLNQRHKSDDADLNQRHKSDDVILNQRQKSDDAIFNRRHNSSRPQRVTMNARGQQHSGSSNSATSSSDCGSSASEEGTVRLMRAGTMEKLDVSDLVLVDHRGMYLFFMLFCQSCVRGQNPFIEAGAVDGKLHLNQIRLAETFVKWEVYIDS